MVHNLSTFQKVVERGRAQTRNNYIKHLKCQKLIFCTKCTLLNYYCTLYILTNAHWSTTYQKVKSQDNAIETGV